MEERHKYHTTVALKKKYMECEDKLNNLAKNMKTDILPTLASDVEQLSKTLDFQEQRLQAVEKEVNEFRERLKTTVDGRCDMMIEGLRQEYKKQTSEISDIISELEKQINDIELFISMCNEKVREGGLDLIEFSKATPPCTDTVLSNVPYTIPTYAPNQNMLDSITDIVGNLKWEAREINLTKPSNHMMPDSEYLKSVVDIKLVSSFSVSDKVTSVVPTGKETAWVASWNSDTMTMYDVTGKRIRSVTLSFPAGFWDLAVKQSGDVIICNNDDKVRLVTVNDDVSTLIDPAHYRPGGVCLTVREEIVVCMGGKDDTDNNHVAMYSTDGKKQIRTIFVKDEQGKQMLTNPFRVVMNGEYFSVLNYGSNVVTCDEDGKVRWVYDGSHSEVGKLSSFGMCVDKFHNLLISDWRKKCIHYVDREGCLLQILLTRANTG